MDFAQLFNLLLQSGIPMQQAVGMLVQMHQQGGGMGGGASPAGAQGQAGGVPGASPAGGGFDPSQLWPLIQALTGGQAMGMLQTPYNMEKQAAMTGLNPAAMARGIGQLTRPLSRQLINSVSRAVSPTITGRGLATSPGMTEQITAEALAPYAQNAQNLAASTYLSGQNQPFKFGGEGLGLSLPETMVGFTNQNRLASENVTADQQMAALGPLLQQFLQQQQQQQYSQAGGFGPANWPGASEWT